MEASRLEVIWCLVSPAVPIHGIKNFICVCIYSPPRSKLNDKLTEHLQFNLNRLSALYPKSGVIIGGDVNNLDMKKLCNTYPGLINLVADPTHGSRILDVIVTDLHGSYDKATILPPIKPDYQGRGHASDHSVAIANT